MEIKKIHQDFSVCKVMDYSLVNLNAEYSFIGKTDEEKSLVCVTSDVPPNVIQRDDGWKGCRLWTSPVTDQNYGGYRDEKKSETQNHSDRWDQILR